MIIDLNMIHALSSGFNYYRGNESAFRALFSGVSESVLGAWFSELGEQYPQFRTRNARGTDTAPMIVVSPLSENVTQTMLGDFDSRSSTGEGVDAYLVRETVELLLIAKSPDLVRVYHVVARASVALARRALHRAGYHLVEYNGADAITPEEELVAEDLGLFMRRLTVSAEHRVAIPIPPSTEFSASVYSGSDVLVLSEDMTTPEGVGGGVSVISD